MDLAIYKRQDLHRLADWLGLERPQGIGNYKSPRQRGKTPSLRIFEADGEWRWDDPDGEGKGSCFDLVSYVMGVETSISLTICAEFYEIPLQRPAANQAQISQSAVELMAARFSAMPDGTRKWLTEERGIPAETVQRYVNKGALGVNNQVLGDWESPTGEGLGFICRDAHGQVLGLDVLERQAAELESADEVFYAVQHHGELSGVPWVPCMRELAKAHTVYVVATAINALSVLACSWPGVHAIASRDTGAVAELPMQLLRGKRVVLGFDNDLPDDKGHRPGPEAAWLLHERCLMADIPALMLDTRDWQQNTWTSINDILVQGGLQDLKIFLRHLSTAAIPGLAGKDDDEPKGSRRRLHLPDHDWRAYWTYKAQPDFTHVVEMKSDGDGAKMPVDRDLCAFRLAGLSRIEVASPRSCMTGEIDSEPSDQFAISVQVADSRRLIRKVVDRDNLFNIDQWKKLGGVFNPQKFTRLLAIWQRATHIGQRKAVNFVGLCWRDGKTVVSEGPDCYFIDPERQCLYHNMVMPNGPRRDAAPVIEAYRRVMRNGAGLQLLVWCLGAHLKAYLGYWPHLVQQAEKGSGKTTLNGWLAKTTKMQMLGPNAIATPFRIVVLSSYSSMPVGLDEFSTNKPNVIDEAIKAAQGCYQHDISPRGGAGRVMLYNQCTPLLFTGEDVPVDSLISKTVRNRLSGKHRGELPPDDLPTFPLRAWLDYLAKQSKADIKARVVKARSYLEDNVTASVNDATAIRMIENYAAVLASWRLLAEWADIDLHGDSFASDLLLEMNAHITETSNSRQPWVWIVEKIFSEISAGRYNYPQRFELETDDLGREHYVWYTRPGHMMDHIFSSPHLRDFAASLPIKSAKVLSQQLKSGGVVIRDRNSRNLPNHQRAGLQRVDHLASIDTEKLEAYGLSAPITVFNEQQAESQGESA